MGHFTFESPLGPLSLTTANGALKGLTFGNLDVVQEEDEITRVTAGQLLEYFEGNRKSFELPVDPDGSEFQKRVWKMLMDIPFGKHTNYGRMATLLGDPRSVRAVGTANGANPIAIIIPCHRVIGANGDLVGYAGGLDKKEWLLKHEGMQGLDQLSIF